MCTKLWLCACCGSAKASFGFCDGQILKFFFSEFLHTNGNLARIKNMGHSQYPNFLSVCSPQSFASVLSFAFSFFDNCCLKLFMKTILFFLALSFWNAPCRGKSRVHCIGLLTVAPIVSLIILQYKHLCYFTSLCTLLPYTFVFFSNWKGGKYYYTMVQYKQ